MIIRIVFVIIFTAFGKTCFSQITELINGDRLNLKRDPNGELVLDRIERGSKNEEAIWVSYDSRYSIDPWNSDSTRGESSYSDEKFVQFFRQNGINILGVIMTYDNCGCSKCRAMHCPDMYLINFKVFSSDWAKMKQLYTHFKDAEVLDF